MEDREILIVAEADEVGRRAAELVVELVRESLRQSGRFSVALSGGSTPKALYSLLAEPQYHSSMEWSKLHVFWGDERCVSPRHPDSNYGMANKSLLNKVPIPKENIHRIPTERPDPRRAAVEYEETLRDLFDLAEGELPRFDLILLGMGEDGHTASLFSGTQAVAETSRLATETYVEKMGTHRVTLTLPVINQAANVMFLIAGASKAPALGQVFARSQQPPLLPSQLVRPVEGRLLFIVDRAAARLVADGKDGP